MKTYLLLALTLVAAGCHSAPSFGPYAAPLHDGTHAAPPDLSSSPNVAMVATSGGTAETSLAISPLDPNRIVLAGSGLTGAGGLRRSEAYVSTDGGRTWSAKWPYPSQIDDMTFSGGGDPGVTVDREGRFYFTSLLGSQSPSRSGLAVARSDDGGLTWNKPVIVAMNTGTVRGYEDKQWIAVDDTGGPHDGNVYLLWGHGLVAFQSVPGQIVFSRSTDRGETWSTPLGLSAVGSNGMAELEVGAGGEVYATYVEAGRGFVIRTSVDGGLTFDEARTIVVPSGPAGKMPNVRAPYRAIQSFAVDRSKGPHRGTLYYLVPSRRGSAGAISVVRSTDGGKSWTAEENVSGDTKGRDAVMPSITVDQSTGEVLAAWLDRRDDAANVMARLYASRSSDGGVTWSEPKPLSAPFSIDAEFIGDYNSAAAWRGQWFAAFSDAGGYMSVARVELGQTVPAAPRRFRRRP